MSRTCGTCVHWGSPSEYTGPLLRQCNFFTEGFASGIPIRVSHIAVAVCASEGISGELMTAAEFGCVEWTEKPR